MFTSDDDSFLGHHEQFLSERYQREVHHSHHPMPYHLPCFGVDQLDNFAGRLDPDPDLDLILLHQQQGEVAMGFMIGDEGNEKGVAVEVEKRVAVASGNSSKKNRHSKITTARGPRDRRMRLSLEVAREFFDLQDMLGFDKASKTVEWLISQSKVAIKEIIRKVRGNDGIAASYASDCEIGFNDNNEGQTVESSSGWKWSKKERKAGQSRMRDGHQRLSSVTRESRVKARERARERTLEMMLKRSLEGSSLNNPRKPCSSSQEAREESSCIQDQTATTDSNLEILTQYEEISGIARQISIDVSSSDLVSGIWSPAAASNNNQNLQELEIPQSQQQGNCEQFIKQWEAFYNYMGFDHS